MASIKAMQSNQFVCGLLIAFFSFCIFNANASNYTSSATSSNGLVASRSFNSKSVPEFRRKAAQLRKDRKLDLHTTVGAKIEVKPSPEPLSLPSTSGLSGASRSNDDSMRFSQPIKSHSSLIGSVSSRSVGTDNGFRPLFSQSSNSPSVQPTQLLNAYPSDHPTKPIAKPRTSSFIPRTSPHSDFHYSLSESRPPSQVFARRQRDYNDPSADSNGAASAPIDESEPSDGSSSGFSSSSSNHEEIDDNDDFRSTGHSSSSSAGSGHHGSSGPEESGSHSSGPSSSSGSYDFPNSSEDDGPSSHGPREHSMDEHSSSIEGPDHDHHHHDSHHHGPPPHLQHVHAENPEVLRGYVGGPPPPFGPPLPPPLPPTLGGRHMFPLGPPPPPFAHMHSHRSPIGPPSLFGSPLTPSYKPGSSSSLSGRSRYPPPSSSASSPFITTGGLSPVHPISFSGSSSPFTGRYRGFSPSSSASAPPSSSSSSSSSNSERSPFSDDFGATSMFSPFGSPSFSFEPFTGSSSAASTSNQASDTFHSGSSASSLPTAAALTGSSPGGSSPFGSFGFKSNDQLSYLNQPDLLGFSALNNNNWYMNQPYLPMMMKQAGVPMMGGSVPGHSDSAAAGASASAPAPSSASGSESSKDANKDKDSGKTRNRLRFNLNRLQSIRLNNIKLPSFLAWASRNSTLTTPASTA